MPDPYAPPSPAPAPVLPLTVAYATPEVRVAGPPVSIKVIGITGVILGGIGVLGHLLGLAMFLVRPALLEQFGQDYEAFQFANSFTSLLAAGALLVGSVGCLGRLDWGRRLLVVWAVSNITLLLVITGATIGWVIPTVMTPKLTGPNGPDVIGHTYRNTAILCVAMLILPIFVLAFLRRSYVRAAFTGGYGDEYYNY